MTLRLYDTARGAVVDFDAGPVVRMYVCGLTPYDATHLGHAATYITYDVLQRRLRDMGRETRCVRNITDVDDDILAAADRRGVHYLDLAFAETARFDDDMAALNTLPPASEPRATSAIPDIRGFIHAALDRGFALLRRTAASTSTRRPSTASDRCRDSGATTWSPSPGSGATTPTTRPSAILSISCCGSGARPGEPSWESRWGPGRPGWHVECSTLALRELGETIDLHGGGADLLYPHHECERAQSEAVTGKPFARHWLHQALVHYQGSKMSKSLGNLVFVHELRRNHEPMAIRLALMSQHYRTPWPWHEGLLEEAENVCPCGAALPATATTPTS